MLGRLACLRHPRRGAHGPGRGRAATKHQLLETDPSLTMFKHQKLLLYVTVQICTNLHFVKHSHLALIKY